MSSAHTIQSKAASIAEVMGVIDRKRKLVLSPEAIECIRHCREFLDKKLNDSDDLFYGINTGFGALCDVHISKHETEELQENLVKSHACGTGEEVPADIVRLMLLLKIQSLSLGHSGIHPDTVTRLVDMYNEDVLPVVYEQGSLGASGDLAPLAHLSLPLLGLGEVRFEGKIQASADVLKAKGWQPLKLRAKEGLALLNGTQFMSAYGLWCLYHGERLSRWADLIAAISLDSFACKTEPFHAGIHHLRPHHGQQQTAQAILTHLHQSEIAAQAKKSVQDPYSFRCIPQVHGATKDILTHASQVFNTEINSVTDNPIILPEEDAILSGGNFHGQPLALALDYLGMGMAELGSISERRTYQLLSGQRGLPPFLIDRSGLHSGLMIPQYTAAGIVSQNRQLTTPASTDSVTSSNGQEDHVSMGANAATKLYRIVQNVERVLAIELLTACQALDFRRPLKSSLIIEKIVEQYRAIVPHNKQDHELYQDIRKTVAFLRQTEI